MVCAETHSGLWRGSACERAKQRITITATGELERILTIEQRLHPHLSPSALVTMLVRRGHHTPDRSRRDLVKALAGGEHYPAGYLEELRDEWPR
jgi:hypothetical protein